MIRFQFCELFYLQLFILKIFDDFLQLFLTNIKITGIYFKRLSKQDYYNNV